jgi:hypothetical protein
MPEITLKSQLYTTDLVNVSCDAANAEWIVFGGAPVMQPAWSQVSLHILQSYALSVNFCSLVFIGTVFANQNCSWGTRIT